MSNHKIAIVNSSSFGRIFPNHLERLKKIGEVKYFNFPQEIPGKELAENLKGYNIIIASVTPFFNAEFFEYKDELLLISRHGIGFNNVDLEAARKHNTIVSIIPALVERDAVAGNNVTNLLAVMRRTVGALKAVEGDQWEKRASFIGHSLYNKVVGVIGIGNTGGCVAETLKFGFRCRVLAHDPYKTKLEIEQHGAEKVEFEDLIRNSDVICLCANLTEENYHFISKKEIEQRLSGSQYAKAKQKIETVYLKRLENQAELWRKEMIKNNEIVTIIWLFGQAGTGKTRLARRYAERFDSNYFITGSIRDPFQQYNLEHVVILDELRPHQFDYSDLLKMFDPYNVKAMASSRYFDKPLLANIYIVTSPYSPYNFFLELNKKRQTSHIDSWGQLMRRLSLVVEVKREHLQFYKYEPIDQMFYIDHGNKLPNPFKNQTDTKETIQDKSYQLFLELNKTKERNE